MSLPVGTSTFRTPTKCRDSKVSHNMCRRGGRKCKRSLRRVTRDTGAVNGVGVYSATEGRQEDAVCRHGALGGRRKEEDIQEEERKGIGSAARSHGERFFWWLDRDRCRRRRRKEGGCAGRPVRGR
jgi:hypothetical protein